MWVKYFFIEWVFIAVAVSFKDTAYIFYYEIHFKYCQDMDV